MTAKNGGGGGIRVMVTGAAGYLGSNIIRKLLHETDVAEVRAGVRSAPSAEALSALFPNEDRMTVTLGELPNEPWSLQGIDTIVHSAAWISLRAEHGGTEEFERVNIRGTQSLVEAARRAGIKRFVFLSSQAVYGTGRPAPWSETTPPEPETVYGRTKVAGESLCLAATEIEVLVLRLARIYGCGSGMRWDELPHKFAATAVRKQPLMINAEGREEVDLLTLDDATSAVVRACYCPKPALAERILNIGSGRSISVLHLAQAILDAASRHAFEAQPFHYAPAIVPPRRFGMTIDRANAVLKWAPLKTLPQAADELIEAAIARSRL